MLHEFFGQPCFKSYAREKTTCCHFRKKGFTLIETMVVITIVSLFSALLFRFYFQSNATQTRLIGNLQMQSALVTGVNKTLREIRTGTGFVYPTLDEESPILIFTDYENNHKAIFSLQNDQASKDAGRNIYDLLVYTSDSEIIDPVKPVHDPKRLRTLCSDLEKVAFRLTSANSAVINFTFHKGGKTFQVVSESALMNSGETR